MTYYTSRTIASALAVAVLLAGAEGAFAQRRGGGDPAEFIKRLDANGNGQIDPDEMNGRGGRFITGMAERAGLDVNQPIPVEKLTQAMEQSRQERERGGEGNSDRRRGDDGDDNDRRRGRDDDRDSRDERDSRGSRSSSRSEEKSSKEAEIMTTFPGIPGFDLLASPTPPPGFDVPLTKSSRYARPLEERFEKQVIEQADNMLRQYDKNKDGRIDYRGAENEGIRWRIPPETTDENKDGKLDREELCYRMARILGSRERTEDDDDDNNSNSSPSRRGGESAPGGSDRMRRFAEGLMRQFDTNKNGQLERDEWSKMRADQQQADSNKDGIITLDELAARMSSFGSRTDTSGGGNTGASGRFGSRSGGSSSSSSSSNGDNKPYRFRTALELLPKGLPDWFARNDANGDGQVAMHEYSSTFNESTAAEFMKYDLNSDGLITADECLTALNPSRSSRRSTTTSSTTTASVSSDRPRTYSFDSDGDDFGDGDGFGGGDGFAGGPPSGFGGGPPANFGGGSGFGERSFGGGERSFGGGERSFGGGGGERSFGGGERGSFGGRGGGGERGSFGGRGSDRGSGGGDRGGGGRGERRGFRGG